MAGQLCKILKQELRFLFAQPGSDRGKRLRFGPRNLTKFCLNLADAGQQLIPCSLG
jgi:hypothetical protein